MNSTKTITKGNRAVVITQQDSNVWANLYVNARGGIHNATITMTRWEGKTVKGAERWAAKKLEV
jgi:hypothetical protein